MNVPGTRPGPSPARRLIASVLGVVALAGLLVWEATRTLPVRRALDAYNRLISAANAGDLDTAGRLYSARYLRDRPPRRAPEGGIVGLPRSGPHKNFRAWRQGGFVLICPTNRVGPVYRFVPEGGGWRFDGLIGLLGTDGRVAASETVGNPQTPDCPQWIASPSGPVNVARDRSYLATGFVRVRARGIGESDELRNDVRNRGRSGFQDHW